MRYQFAEYEFDPERGLAGPRGPIPLGRRDAAVLLLLLESDGRIVSKDAMVDAAWRGRSISDDSIFQSVRRLRVAMPAPAGNRIVETVYGVGTRIGVPVQAIPDRPASTGIPRDSATGDTDVNLAAARECLATAREFVGRRGLQDMVSATLAARHAVRLAPDSVDAWVLLAQISVLRVNRGQLAAPRVGIHRALRSAGRALQLNPDADGALTIIGWITAVINGDAVTGVATIDKAVAINSADWATHTFRAWALFAAHRPDEGLAAFAAMMRCNPLSTLSTGTYAYALGCTGQFASAFAVLNNAIGRMPTIDSLFSARSSIAAMTGDLDLALRDARRCAELSPDLPNQMYALAYALAANGAVDDARALLARMVRMRCRLAPSLLALVLAGLRDASAAADALRRAKREGCPWLSFVQYDPRLRGIVPTEAPQIRAAVLP